MLTIAQREKAGEIRMALMWGYTDVSEAVSWIDSIIEDAETIDDDMTNVSLSRDVSTAINYLNRISSECSEWNILRLFLRRFENKTTMSFGSASKLAQHLYLKVMNDEGAPSDMSCFSSHWDDIDLAIDGIFGDPEEKIENFLKDIRVCANMEHVDDIPELVPPITVAARRRKLIVTWLVWLPINLVVSAVLYILVILSIEQL